MHLKTEPRCLSAIKECRIQNTNRGWGQGKFAAGEREREVEAWGGEQVVLNDVKT